MKKPSTVMAVIAFAISTLITLSSQAQILDPPKDGAALRMENYTVQLNPGESITEKVWLVRSKSYKKAKFGGITASSHEGIELTFTPIEGEPDVYQMRISADEKVELKKYNILLKGEGKNSHKVKLRLVSLLVTSEQIAKENR